MLLAQNEWPRTIYRAICSWVLPLGFLLLLTGMFFLPGRSLYQRLFYILLAAPALVTLILQPGILRHLLLNPVIQAFLLFSAWALLSLAWSTGDDSSSSLIKRPLLIFLLFSATTLITLQNTQRLEHCLYAGALVALTFALYALALFAQNWTEGSRLVGTGALDNPLLSSHLYGFFCVIWLGFGMTKPSKQAWLSVLPIAVLLLTLLATGSRTPLVAISLASTWLILSCWNKRAAYLLGLGVISLTSLLLLFPEILLDRGTSHRLEIWQFVLHLVAQQPLIGHGLDAPLAVPVLAMSMEFSEPHSFAIGVLYYTGLIGLSIWLSMHFLGLISSWRQRREPLFIIAGALLVYGMGAGLAEGGGIFVKPKEHWFLIWIPLALIAALTIASSTRKDTQN